jgi:hypothetical protein
VTTKLVNLTPHDVVVVVAEDSVTIAPHSSAARVSATDTEIGAIEVADGQFVPLVQSELGKVEDLPDVAPDVLYIVSRPVFEAADERTDLVVPSDLVRDERGAVVACRAFLCRASAQQIS